MKYLLAAEADRIQYLLFRSSRLREVVGGSQLLSRFCKEVKEKPLLLVPGLEAQVDVITSGGGSFYVEFENEDGEKAEAAARQFGAALAEAYNRATGGTLSVAKPVEVTAGYGPASEEAGERLRQAKRRGPAVMTPHIPYIAFCESCGVGLAVAHEARVEEEERAFYLCPSCRAKAAERVERGLGGFLKPFYEAVVGQDALPKMDWPHEADAVGEYDVRGYVAYIIADGNGMGEVFGKCGKEQAKELSGKMDDVLREALAEPIRLLMSNPAANRRPQFVPALPLIMGGDDLFALVPAPWALDIARRLCATFQSEMTKFAQGQGIPYEITMTAAVVICKANYPYYLAHQIGEERLSAAKRMVKALARTGTHLSAVDFEAVLGSQAAPKELTGGRRPTLRPYWVADGKVPSGWGLPINALLDWRYRLTLPSRRLSQLRAHFGQVPKDGSIEALQHWDKDLRYLLERIERDWAQEGKHPVRVALEELGGAKLEEWYSVERKSDEEFRRGHGMPDLLRVWEWALNLDHSKSEYEGGER